MAHLKSTIDLPLKSAQTISIGSRIGQTSPAGVNLNEDKQESLKAVLLKDLPVIQHLPR